MSLMVVNLGNLCHTYPRELASKVENQCNHAIF